MEYDLAAMGIDIRHAGQSDLTWRRLEVLIAGLAGDPRSATYRSINPDHWWGIAEHLHASAVDALNLLVWSKTEDASKGRNRPVPIPRPGTTDRKRGHTRRFGGTSMTQQQARQWLDRRRRGSE